QQRAEIALEIAAERAQILRQRLRELPRQVVEIEAVRVVGHTEILRPPEAGRESAGCAGNITAMIPRSPRPALRRGPARPGPAHVSRCAVRRCARRAMRYNRARLRTDPPLEDLQLCGTRTNSSSTASCSSSAY